jgi:hypothetical protein
MDCLQTSTQQSSCLSLVESSPECEIICDKIYKNVNKVLFWLLYKNDKLLAHYNWTNCQRT